jgi:hypothetical protein
MLFRGFAIPRNENFRKKILQRQLLAKSDWANENFRKFSNGSCYGAPLAGDFFGN